MEYTLYELREMLNYMDAQLQDQAPYFDDRLLSRRRNVAQAVANLEESERTLVRSRRLLREVETRQTEKTREVQHGLPYKYR
jgi:hypothetical protein